VKLAVIPARGGSKRIPRKNVRDFCGRPIIAWSIQAARDSLCFDRIIVSTDDPEIADVARAAGAEVPFLRPATLADDHTGTMPVISHAIEWQRSHGVAPDMACCLYATAPFVRAFDLCAGLDALNASGAAYAFTVTTYASPIQRALRLTSAGRLAMFEPERFATRSQDLETAYHDAGQFYWGRCDAWSHQRPIFSDDAVPIVLPRHRVQDIDSLEDWTRAEWLFRALQEQDDG
jgi:pseudaminic acid cytidylyltransferase